MSCHILWKTYKCSSVVSCKMSWSNSQKMMSLLISSNGHLKSRWGQRGKRCACWGWEFIAGHGSTEHLENQSSGKSIWHRASSFSINFCQREKKKPAELTREFFQLYISHCTWFTISFLQNAAVQYGMFNDNFYHFDATGCPNLATAQERFIKL